MGREQAVVQPGTEQPKKSCQTSEHAASDCTQTYHAACGPSNVPQVVPPACSTVNVFQKQKKRHIWTDGFDQVLTHKRDCLLCFPETKSKFARETGAGPGRNSACVAYGLGTPPPWLQSARSRLWLGCDLAQRSQFPNPELKVNVSIVISMRFR